MTLNLTNIAGEADTWSRQTTVSFMYSKGSVESFLLSTFTKLRGLFEVNLGEGTASYHNSKMIQWQYFSIYSRHGADFTTSYLQCQVLRLSAVST